MSEDIQCYQRSGAELMKYFLPSMVKFSRLSIRVDDLSHKTEALRTLHGAVRLTDKPQALILFAAALTIQKEMEAYIEGLSEEGKPHNANYLLEKLGSFIDYFEFAVMPSPESDHRAAELWLADAGNMLNVFQGFAGSTG